MYLLSDLTGDEVVNELMLDAEPYYKPYAESLRDHIRFVKEAGGMTGVDPQLLEKHDNSKWTLAEFPHYAKHFHGGGDPEGFSYAWLHHIHHNPHHWQHWIYPNGFKMDDSDVEDGGIVEMPFWFAKEMIADWMGASMAYTGSWDMIDWLAKNIPKIRVHSSTASFLRGELDALGYADVVHGYNFASEASE